MEDLGSYEEICGDIGVGILLSDSEGKIFEINSAARKLLCVEENLNEPLRIGESVIQKVLKEDFSYWHEHPVLNALKNEQAITNQIVGVYDNEAKLSWLNLNVLIKNGTHSNYFVITLYDISPAKQSLKELKKEFDVATKRAGESDRLKSAFFANISHEIRTPMNGILGFSELLRKTGLSEENIQKYTDVVIKSGKRLLNIIDDLIDISSIESGAVQIRKEKVYINHLLRKMHKIYEKEASDLGIEFDYDLELPDGKCVLETDENKLEQIVSILIKNSLKFTKRGKVIFGYEILDDKQCLRFYIKDTGIGIPKEMQTKIFKPFVQADTSYNRAYEGAGLGLAICKEYIELLGGKIWVDSDPGNGSTFFFTIPGLEIVKQKKNGFNSGQLNSTDLLRGITILIADDDNISSWLIREGLKGLDTKLVYAEDGKKAVELVKENPDIRLVIMDVKMPVLNGIEATKIIKDIRPNLPVIGQTAFALSDDVKAGLKAGWDYYVTKPIDIEELREKMKEVFSKG